MSNARELAELGGSYGTGGFVGMKNRIINGAMMIDQRNAGVSVTVTAANFVYPVDRMFAYRSSGTSGAIAQRVASGIVGGAYALRIQRNSGDTSTAALGFGQTVETSNCYDLAGQNAAVSFKARCGANFSASGSAITMRTTTGTAADQGSAGGYNSTWTGNTNVDTNFTLTTSWQSFSVVVPVGSTVQEILNRFSYTPTGTAGANDWFEVTEVQLEKGSTATSFDYRPYGTELALCQRYYYRLKAGSSYANAGTGKAYSLTNGQAVVALPVSMRAAPIGGYSALADWNAAQASGNITALSPAAQYSLDYRQMTVDVTATMTSNQPIILNANNTTNAWIDWSAEL